jgi:hypothetical protein
MYSSDVPRIALLSVSCQVEWSRAFYPPYFLPAAFLNIFVRSLSLAGTVQTVECGTNYFRVNDQVVCEGERRNLSSKSLHRIPMITRNTVWGMQVCVRQIAQHFFLVGFIKLKGESCLPTNMPRTESGTS